MVLEKEVEDILSRVKKGVGRKGKNEIRSKVDSIIQKKDSQLGTMMTYYYKYICALSKEMGNESNNRKTKEILFLLNLCRNWLIKISTSQGQTRNPFATSKTAPNLESLQYETNKTLCYNYQKKEDLIQTFNSSYQEKDHDRKSD